VLCPATAAGSGRLVEIVIEYTGNYRTPHVGVHHSHGHIHDTGAVHVQPASTWNPDALVADRHA
jgi:hypothetical protein